MDNVNSPAHYQRGGIETITYLESTLGKQGFFDYCIGNVLKYVSRWRDKNGIEDLKKARWYLDRVIDTIEKEEDNRDRNKAVSLGERMTKIQELVDGVEVDLDALLSDEDERDWEKEMEEKLKQFDAAAKKATHANAR